MANIRDEIRHERDYILDKYSEGKTIYDENHLFHHEPTLYGVALDGIAVAICGLENLDKIKICSDLLDDYLIEHSGFLL